MEFEDVEDLGGEKERVFMLYEVPEGVRNRGKER